MKWRLREHVSSVAHLTYATRIFLQFVLHIITAKVTNQISHTVLSTFVILTVFMEFMLSYDHGNVAYHKFDKLFKT